MFYWEATNAKVVKGADSSFCEEKLREAVKLSGNLSDEIWAFIPSYRLAHLLFRKAESDEELYEILELLEHSAKSKSEFIKIHSHLLKFIAIDRRARLGVQNLGEEQSKTLNQIVGLIRPIQEANAGLGPIASHIQGDYFNLLEYLVYMTGLDYTPLLGVGFDDKNTLFPGRSHDVWRIVGPDGPIDDFTYNAELGWYELLRHTEEVDADAWFVRSSSAWENKFLNASGAVLNKPNHCNLVHVIMRAGPLGAGSAEMAASVGPANYESVSDSGSKEISGESTVKKLRKSMNEWVGKELFVQTSKGRSGSSWALKSDVKIFGMINQKFL